MSAVIGQIELIIPSLYLRCVNNESRLIPVQTSLDTPVPCHSRQGEGLDYREVGVVASMACEKVNTVGTDKNLFCPWNTVPKFEMAAIFIIPRPNTCTQLSLIPIIIESVIFCPNNYFPSYPLPQTLLQGPRVCARAPTVWLYSDWRL